MHSVDYLSARRIEQFGTARFPFTLHFPSFGMDTAPSRSRSAAAPSPRGEPRMYCGSPLF